MSNEVEPRFHFTGDDRAFIDFIAPQHERESRQEIGHQFATTIEKVLGQSDPDFTVDKAVSQYLVSDAVTEHMERRITTAKEIKRLSTIRKAIRNDVDGHFTTLSLYFLPGDREDEQETEEYETFKDSTSETPEKDFIFPHEGEELIDWMQRVADSVDRYYDTPEGKAEELHEARIGNITDLITSTLPGDNYLARIATSLKYGNSDEEIESMGIETPQVLNDLMSYVMLRLNVSISLRDAMYLLNPESATKAHHSIINSHVELPNGRKLFVAKAFTIYEKQLLDASLSRLLKREVEPEATYFVTDYQLDREESGASKRVHETTYERSTESGEIEFYAGPPRHPAAHYFSHSLLHGSKGPDLNSYLRRLPVWPGEIKKLIDDMNGSSG